MAAFERVPRTGTVSGLLPPMRMRSRRVSLVSVAVGSAKEGGAVVIVMSCYDGVGGSSEHELHSRNGKKTDQGH